MLFDTQSYVLGLFTALLFILAGSIFFRKEKFKSGIYFTFSMFFGGLWTLTSIFNRNLTDPELALFSNKLAYLSAVLTIFFILIFSETFPKQRKTSIRKIIFFTLAVLILGIVLFATDLIIERAILRTNLTNEGVVFGSLFGLYAFVAIGIVVVIMSNFIYSLQHYKGVVRDQLRYILIGSTMTSFLAIFFGAILPLMGIYKLGYLSPFSAIIGILFIYYSIFRYRFLDFRLLIVYSLETLVLMFIAYFFFYSITLINETFFGGIYSQGALLWGVVYSSVFIFSIKYVSNFINFTLIDPFFGFNNLSAEVNQLLGTTLDRYELSRIFSDFLQKKFGSENVVVIYKIGSEKADNKYIVFYDSVHTKDIGKPWKFVFIYDLEKIVQKNKNIELISDELGIRNFEGKKLLPQEVIVALRKLGIQISLPISLDDKIVSGFVLVGNKSSGDAYSLQEIQLIRNLNKIFTFAIHRAVLYSETEEFAKTLTQKIDIATKKLRLKYEEERDMVGILGHELRTPLTIARNMLDLLISKLSKMKEKGEIDYNYLNNKAQSIKDALVRETTIVETALSTSRVDNQKVQLLYEKIDIIEIVKFVFDAFESQANQKGLKLIFEKPTETPNIVSDQSKILEIVTNLVSNAIKYTTEGEIIISLEFDRKYLYFKVKDSGEGIPEDLIRKLGQKFYRVNQYLDADHNVVRAGGTGLGLYVVKGYLKLMKGDLIIHSKVNEGSTFIAKIPLDNPSEEQNKTVNISSKGKDKQDLFVKLGFVR